MSLCPRNAPTSRTPNRKGNARAWRKTLNQQMWPPCDGEDQSVGQQPDERCTPWPKHDTLMGQPSRSIRATKAKSCRVSQRPPRTAVADEYGSAWRLFVPRPLWQFVARDGVSFRTFVRNTDISLICNRRNLRPSTCRLPIHQSHLHCVGFGNTLFQLVRSAAEKFAMFIVLISR